jgi:hypothetical protein
MLHRCLYKTVLRSQAGTQARLAVAGLRHVPIPAKKVRSFEFVADGAGNLAGAGRDENAPADKKNYGFRRNLRFQRMASGL